MIAPSLRIKKVKRCSCMKSLTLFNGRRELSSKSEGGTVEELACLFESADLAPNREQILSRSRCYFESGGLSPYLRSTETEYVNNNHLSLYHKGKSAFGNLQGRATFQCLKVTEPNTKNIAQPCHRVTCCCCTQKYSPMYYYSGV